MDNETFQESLGKVLNGHRIPFIGYSLSQSQIDELKKGIDKYTAGKPLHIQAQYGNYFRTCIATRLLR